MVSLNPRFKAACVMTNSLDTKRECTISSDEAFQTTVIGRFKCSIRRTEVFFF